MLDECDKRVAAIFERDCPPSVDVETLYSYFLYLEDEIKLPCQLQTSNKSNSDIYNLVKLDDEVLTEDYGILVKVKLAGTRKSLVLPLVELAAVDCKTRNYQLIDDYSMWYVNYR